LLSQARASRILPLGSAPRGRRGTITQTDPIRGNPSTYGAGRVKLINRPRQIWLGVGKLAHSFLNLTS
jgi:hypothetical protein